MRASDDHESEPPPVRPRPFTSCGQDRTRAGPRPVIPPAAVGETGHQGVRNTWEGSADGDPRPSGVIEGTGELATGSIT